MVAGLGRNETNKADVIRFDVLPDDVLLDIFDFYVGTASCERTRKEIEAWQSLVHVCRRWRTLVFLSPRRLNLRLLCTSGTRARDALDTWPALPVILKSTMARSSSDMDNVIAALGHSDRICELILRNLTGQQLEQVSAATQVPFPELTYLQVKLTYFETPLVFPDTFLGRSAPRLRHFELHGIPFPGLPTLLLSTSHLVYLRLEDVPYSGYISPTAMAALLSALSSLEVLSLGSESSESFPDWEPPSPPPPKRSILPALKDFRFNGVTEYLEDLVTIIDAPQLNKLQISFFHHISLDTQRLAQFISRTPKLGKWDKAYVEIDDGSAGVQFGTLEISMLYAEPDRQLSFVARVCNSFLLPTVEDLFIGHPSLQFGWMKDAIENSLWLQLLLPFTAVKNLYLSEEFAPSIAAALQELVGTRITEVLPSLQNIFVEELKSSGPSSFQENVGQFVAARQLSDHPIAISGWHEEVTCPPS